MVDTIETYEEAPQGASRAVVVWRYSGYWDVTYDATAS